MPSAAPAIDNVFVAWWQGRQLPEIDLSMIAVLGALAAISGNGGLTNTALSGYARDQGWGMGKHVGAIPSVDRRPEVDALPRRHGVSDQRANRSRAFAAGIASCCAISLSSGCRPASSASRCPACSRVQFLPRGTQVERLGRRRHDGRRPARRRRPALRPVLLADDAVLRLPRAGARPPSPRSTARCAAGSICAGPPSRSSAAGIRIASAGSISARVCGYAVFGLTALTLWNPQAAARVGHATSTTPRSASVASTCWP